MLFKSTDPLFSKQLAYYWAVLSFQAGAVNAGGFLACHRFVSHVTGFATHFGIDAAFGAWDVGLSMLSVPVFFLLGSMLSAFLVDYRRNTGRRARYDWVMGVMTLLFVFTTFGGYKGWFGSFGEPYKIGHDYSLLAILSFACGLQNAVFTSASGAIVRTTHLTGITTDLGIGIVRVLSTFQNPLQRKRETRSNWLRFLSILFFILGSTAGAFIHHKNGYLGFALPALLAFHFFVIDKVLHLSDQNMLSQPIKPEA